jgi:uncharacterized protein (DUF427 family)
VALTLAKSPLFHPPLGTFNFAFDSVTPQHILYVEHVPRRIRGILAGRTIVDSRRATMLHETNELVQWYFPLEDVANGALETAEHGKHDTHKGSVLHYNVRCGDRFEGNAAWQYPDPPLQAPFLRGLIAFHFDRLDKWLEEDDEVFGHPRDPYHRFDVRRSSDHVVVRVGGEIVAETTRAIKLFETSSPIRLYIPMEDVRPGVLTPTKTRTYCPYKGEAAYFDVHAGSHTIRDGAWTLPEPLGEAKVCLNHVSFWRGDTKVYANDEHVPLT